MEKTLTETCATDREGEKRDRERKPKEKENEREGERERERERDGKAREAVREEDSGLGLPFVCLHLIGLSASR